MPSPETEQLRRIETKVDKINELLTGNGNPSKGLIIRTDRLEQKLAGWAKAAWIAGGVVITAVVGTLLRIFTAGGNP